MELGSAPGQHQSWCLHSSQLVQQDQAHTQIDGHRIDKLRKDCVGRDCAACCLEHLAQSSCQLCASQQPAGASLWQAHAAQPT